KAGFICVWDRDTPTGTAGKIGAGGFTPWCNKVIDRSGLPKWELMKRLADPEYAARAEEWDAKTEAWKAPDQRDQYLPESTEQALQEYKPTTTPAQQPTTQEVPRGTASDTDASTNDPRGTTAPAQQSTTQAVPREIDYNNLPKGVILEVPDD